jgi:peroxiredoxin (alkyl hydroperoxide reductase subunit C)
MIKINEKVPDFEAKAFYKEDEHKIKLSDYSGKWVVLIFYPGDFTFVCPTELEEAAQHYHDFQELKAEVISISTDSVHTHKAWHDTSPAIQKVEYPMASDLGGHIARLFGVYIEQGEDMGRALRGTFIIDPDGVLKTIEINNNDVGRNTGETLRKLKAAQYVREHGGSLVCPASWEPGEETLKPGLDLVGKI